jgi:hypothetical protein
VADEDDSPFMACDEMTSMGDLLNLHSVNFADMVRFSR